MPFGSSLSTDQDRPFDEHFDYLLELANHDELWDKFEEPDTQKWLRKWVTSSHNTPGGSVFMDVNGLLAEVQTDWEDLKEMLCPIEGIGQYNRLITWPPAKSAGGVVSPQ